MKFVSGFGGTAKIGTTELPIKQWTARITSRTASYENSKTGGYVGRDPSGGKSADVTLNCDFDFDANPVASANGGVRVGVKLTNVILYLNGTGTGNMNYTFPSLVVDGTDTGVTHTGTNAVPYNVTGHSDLTFYEPGDTVPGGAG